MSGFEPDWRQGAPWYAATKFAVEGWTDGFRREMMPFGVSVSLVVPGFFKTVRRKQ